jgi:hypothetical protein
VKKPIQTSFPKGSCKVNQRTPLKVLHMRGIDWFDCVRGSQSFE